MMPSWLLQITINFPQLLRKRTLQNAINRQFRTDPDTFVCFDFFSQFYLRTVFSSIITPPFNTYNHYNSFSLTPILLCSCVRCNRSMWKLIRHEVIGLGVRGTPQINVLSLLTCLKAYDAGGAQSVSIEHGTHERDVISAHLSFLSSLIKSFFS